MAVAVAAFLAPAANGAFRLAAAVAVRFPDLTGGSGLGEGGFGGGGGGGGSRRRRRWWRL